jgi:hypothetical protein
VIRERLSQVGVRVPSQSRVKDHTR